MRRNVSALQWITTIIHCVVVFNLAAFLAANMVYAEALHLGPRELHGLLQSSVSSKHDESQIMREKADALAKQGRFTEARQLLERGCDGGDMESCNELAIFYEGGQGTETNPGRALALFRKACEGKSANACHNLTIKYLYGADGLAKDPGQSAIWALKACDYGAAKYTPFRQLMIYCGNLVNLYRSGYVAEQDIPKASAVLDRACKGDMFQVCGAVPGHRAPNTGGNSEAQARQPGPQPASESVAPDGAPAPPSGQTSTSNYPTLTADQLRDLVTGSHDIAFMARMLQIRQHPEELNTATVIGKSTDLKFFIQLNNCNNPQMNRLLDNEFEYPKIAAYYKERAKEILSEVPSTISYWRTVSLGQYDSSAQGFRVDPEPRIIQVDGVGYPDCKIFGGLPLTRTQEGFVIRSRGDVDRYVVVPFQLTRLPMPEEAARQYLDGLPNPTQRQIALKFTIQITPDSVSCKSQDQVRGEIEAAARGEASANFNSWINQLAADVNRPEDRKWADSDRYVEQQTDALQSAEEQWQDARNECMYAGPLADKVEVAVREGGPVLSSFDPNPTRGSDRLQYWKPHTFQDGLAIATYGTADEFPYALSAFLARSIAGSNLRIEDYAKEQEFIANAVKLCSSLTPEMRRKGWENRQFHPDVVGQQYAVCNAVTNVTKAVRPYDPARERALMLGIGLSSAGTGALVSFDKLQGEYIAVPLELEVLSYDVTDDSETPVTADSGEWLDSEHNRIWTLSGKQSQQSYENPDAEGYCRALRTGGSTTWQLPTFADLQTIQDPRALQALPGGFTLRIPGEPIWTEGNAGLFSPGRQVLMATGPDGRLTWSPLSIERDTVRVLCVRPYRWWLAGHTVAATSTPNQQSPGGSSGAAPAADAEDPSCKEKMVTAVGFGQLVQVQVQFVNETDYERKLYRIDAMGFKHSNGSVRPHSTSRPINGLAGQVWLVEDQNQKCVIKFRAQSSLNVTLEK